ncbi:branched-chain amino acid ABC transporter permease [Anaeromassilibacillus sp. An200]|uniref:branched-chain amino acid ABC transporter permease n=1 Tax=Anaeromassilibacillus sp. An200 TaxID=1965587 RepID=UPI0019CFD50C|nr:branched-chain amino acid ABC transporter permease [Anaeromassilibacillus sp. An200]
MTKSKKTGRIPKSKLLSYAVNAGLLLVFYFLFFALIANGTINRYSSGIMTTMFINIILTVSLNLVSGFLGQLVLGHAGFMSVGAYTAALFTLYSGLPITIAFPISIVLAGVMAAVFGVIIGVPALRLRGDYLAIITLGFGEIIRVIILACDFTGGAKGLRGIPTILPKGSDATSLALAKYSYVFWLAVITVVVIWAFVRSRHGRAVIAIREDEIAAEASGIHTTYYKLFAFVMAAFFAGVAGSVYAHHIGVLDPGKFNFDYSVEILLMAVLGGLGSITGSIIAAVALTILPEFLRGFEDYRMLIYAVILIIVMLFKPSGLMGQREFSLSGLAARLTAKKRKGE